MVFQPTSPIRLFQSKLFASNLGDKHDSRRQADKMSSKRASTVLEKLNIKSSPTRSNSKEGSENSTISPLPSERTDDAEVKSLRSILKLTEHRSTVSVNATSPQSFGSMAPHLRRTETTNSSPVDPTYVPVKAMKEDGIARPSSLSKTASRVSTQPISSAEQSFFDSDSDSGSDTLSPVIGRASSVRMSKPTVIESNSSLHSGLTQMCGSGLAARNLAVSPLSSRLSEASESMTVNQIGEQMKRGGPLDALEYLEGNKSRLVQCCSRYSQMDPEVLEIIDGLPVKSPTGGLSSNPITEGEKHHIQRTISAPPLPPRLQSVRKVRIRPSELVFDHSRNSARLFREAVVTTPYPILNNVDEEMTEKGDKRIPLPQTSNSERSARFTNDRFPSPDRSETLFLNLGLARHPFASTLLEIKITDKGTYDDEKLFQQIRAAYRSRLVGLSRFPFTIVRKVSFATVSPSVQFDFRATEFLKHFVNPRVGRKRKTWVIWLRHHSRQHSPSSNGLIGSAKRPLSASLRTTDKRLSTHSDSSSTVKLSFLSPLSIPRIPFFNKEPIIAASELSNGSSFDHEEGSGVIKIELHHEFSFWRLALIYLWILCLSIASTVFWTIFGVPGSRPGDETVSTPAAKIASHVAWNAAAQARVLTGLVLGMMVALLGSMTEVCLIAGGYVLL